MPMLTRRALLAGGGLAPLAAARPRRSPPALQKGPLMGWVDLGTAPPITAAADTTGQNTGNLTTVVDKNALGLSIGQYNIWHMVLENVPIAATAKIVVNTRTFSYLPPSSSAGLEWNGNMFLRDGDTLYFYWQLAASAAKPILTVYLVADPDLTGNRGLV